MKFLIDTHVLLWAAFEESSLSRIALQILQSDAEILVSAASAWEVATKYRLGRLDHARDLIEDFVPQVLASGYQFLSISPEHALRAGRFDVDHKDPFDRMLAAQAVHEDMVLLSSDKQLDQFNVRREW